MDQSKIIKAPYMFAVDITNDCNYRCLHCYNASGENNTVNSQLTDTEIIALFKDIASMHPQSVCICGGEPLIKFDLVCKCANILYKAGVKGIGMVSNGYFLTQERANVLYKSHFNNVQISLDGSNSNSCYKLRRNKEAYNKAIEAIQYLKNAGFKNNAIAFCPTKWNIEELKDVVKICKKLGVVEIRIQPLMIIGRGAENAENIVPTAKQYIELLRTIEYFNQTEKDILLSWADPLDHLFRMQHYNHMATSYVTIKANGNIMVSPYLPISVGNIRRHSFNEYWNNGLSGVWNTKFIQESVKKISCINDMVENNGVKTWLDTDVEIDLIDDESNF